MRAPLTSARWERKLDIARPGPVGATHAETQDVATTESAGPDSVAPLAQFPIPGVAAASGHGQTAGAGVTSNPVGRRLAALRRVAGEDGTGDPGGGTGVLYMDSEGVAHKEPDTTKAPRVFYMDPHGVAHKEPDKTTTPGVLHMDPHGVAHKEPDKTTTPGVLHMDPHGVAHKEPDKAPTPGVFQMDEKGSAHVPAENPQVAQVHELLKRQHDQHMRHAGKVKDIGAKWQQFKQDALAARQDAQLALNAGTAVWNVEAADSGVVAAEKAKAAKDASAAAAKAKTDAHALDPAFQQAMGQTNGLENNRIGNLAQFRTDRPRWLKDASPWTKVALTEMRTFLSEQAQATVDARAVGNGRDATLNAIDQAATEAANDATSAGKPLAKCPGLYVIVGMMQQKLNMANGGPRIPVTAMWDVPTVTALKQFQQGQGLPVTGMADLATWTALNGAAPSVERNGQLRVEDEDKSATARPDAGVHPELSFPASGGAVRELQERLNNWRDSVAGKKPFSRMSIDGIFGLKTRSAVKAFQKAHGLRQTAVVEDATWAELDKEGTVTKGVRQFESTQICEGMLTGGMARYDWEITKTNKLLITVKINFTGEKKHPMVANWLRDITDVWNHYKAVEVGGARQYDIEFKPVASSSGHHKVRVRKPTKADPNPRSDSANWYVNDTRKGLAPHEFGHLVGLDDEYNRPEEQYVETTGQEPAIGKLVSSTGKNSGEIADLIWQAVNSNGGQPDESVSTGVADVVRNEGIEQGAFARLVIKRFETKHPYPQAFKTWARRAHRPVTFTTYLAYMGANEWTDDLTDATEAFSESNTSLMGTMESVPQGADHAALAAIPQHDHPVQPRHLRSFTALLVAAMPGTKWKLEKQ